MKVIIEVVPLSAPFPSISLCNMRNLDTVVLNRLNRIFIGTDLADNEDDVDDDQHHQIDDNSSNMAAASATVGRTKREAKWRPEMPLERIFAEFVTNLFRNDNNARQRKRGRRRVTRSYERFDHVDDGDGDSDRSNYRIKRSIDVNDSAAARAAASADEYNTSTELPPTTSRADEFYNNRTPIEKFMNAYMQAVAKYYPMHIKRGVELVKIIQTVLSRTTISTNIDREILQAASVPFKEFIVTCRL